MRYITSIKINILGILGVLCILTSAYFVEYYYSEPPCPLCLLQRWGFLATLFGFLLNLKFGNRMQHYGLSLIGCLFTAGVAVRQILLHIFTTSTTYGPALFTLHLYTWSFLASVLFILFIAFALILEPPQHGIGERPKWVSWTVTLVFIISISYGLANSATTFLICGFKECPENPVKYIYSHTEMGRKDYLCS